MFSVNDLPDNQAIQFISDIDRDLDELKNAQRVGGDSLVTHYNTTSDTWDVDETVPNSITFIRWRVVFTPDHGGNPFSLLGYNYTLTPNDTTRPILSYPDPSYISTTGIAYLIAFTNNNFTTDTDVKIKVAITSMDTGTLTITKVFEV